MSVKSTNIPPELAESPVFERGPGVNAGLARPESGVSWLLGVGGVMVLGVVTFTALAGARQSVAKPAAQVAQVAKPDVDPAPFTRVSDAAPPVVMPTTTPAQPAPTSPDYHAPAMVVDLSQAPTEQPHASAFASAGTSSKDAATGEDKMSADERFSAHVGAGGVNVAHASRLHNLSQTAPQGTVISAVLETAINSDLPGFVRAVVSRDVRGFDGSTVVIPRGSKLVGQYRSGVANSQTRAFVVWSRLLTPDGVAINIASPGTDRLGRGGLDGETDTHFFQRFGSAILLSVMSSGLNALSNRTNNTSVFIGSSQDASQVASIALQKNIDIPATITVPQGTPMQVFITRDLDFSGTVPAP